MFIREGVKMTKNQLYSISGDSGEVKFKGISIAEILSWKVCIYQEYLETGSFGGEFTTVEGLKTLKGSARIRWITKNKTPDIYSLIITLEEDTVELNLSNSKSNTSYKAKALLKFKDIPSDEQEVELSINEWNLS